VWLVGEFTDAHGHIIRNSDLCHVANVVVGTALIRPIEYLDPFPNIQFSHLPVEDGHQVGTRTQPRALFPVKLYSKHIFTSVRLCFLCGCLFEIEVPMLYRSRRAPDAVTSLRMLPGALTAGDSRSPVPSRNVLIVTI
jgi:hypothetical protein